VLGEGGVVVERGVGEKPLILITTSHRPSQRVRSFVKDLASVLPRAVKVNRGKSTLRDLYYDAVGLGVKRVVVVSTWKGNPGTIWVYEPLKPPEQRLGLLLSLRLRGVRLSRETPGAVRSRRSRSLGVYPEGGEEQRLLADMLVRGFLGRLVFDPETPGFDSVAVVRPAEGLVAEVGFLCGGKRCGPLLRVVGAVDYASGVRLHRAAGAAGAAGGVAAGEPRG
jgi:U3 small nucleolar ribonucleoprotein protein IMP4